MIIHSFSITRRRTNKSSFALLTNQKNAEGGTGTGLEPARPVRKNKACRAEAQHLHMLADHGSASRQNLEVASGIWVGLLTR